MVVRSIPIEDITIPRGRRKPEESRVKSVARSIQEVGLLHPIVLNESYRLIAGRTRLESAILLGWKTIDATIMDVDELHAELAEIIENLERSNLTGLEEVQALKRMKDIYLSLHPETRAGVAGAAASNAVQGKGDATDIMSVASFSRETADKTGKTERTIRRDIATAEHLSEEAAEAIKDTPIADNKAELKRLADLPEREQVAAAKKIKAGKAKNVRQATGDKPKQGQQRKDPRLWKQIEEHLGAALRQVDDLNRQFPHGVLHRTLISQIKSAMSSLAAWKGAAR